MKGGAKPVAAEEIYSKLMQNLGTRLKKRMGWNEDMVYSRLWRKLLHYTFIRGCFMPILVLSSFFLMALGALFIDVWLGLMSLNYFGLSENTYFYVYLGTTAALIISGYLRDLWFFKEMQRNSNLLHKQLMDKVFQMKAHWAQLFPRSNISYKATMDTMVLDQKLS